VKRREEETVLAEGRGEIDLFTTNSKSKIPCILSTSCKTGSNEGGSPNKKIFTTKHERGSFCTPYTLIPLFQVRSLIILVE